MHTIREHARTTRAMWAAGDYPAIAKAQVWPVGERVVSAAAVKSGDRVLDVACGSGNAALRAALAGGSVVGLDLTPELFPAGRTLAAEAGVEIDWIEGDAEALPFPDESFDVVLSTFGCMFAPRHDVTARELGRVVRPGGRMALTAWTPEGGVGTFFARLDSYLPAPPDFAAPSILWGSEAHVRKLFAGSGLELSFDREVLAEPEGEASVDEVIEFLSAKFGPLVVARERAEAGGRWPDLRADLLELVNDDAPAEYLLIHGVRAH